MACPSVLSPLPSPQRPVANTTGESHFGSPESPATTVWRRFSDFELLRQYFAYIIPSALLPPLPEKTMNFKIAKLGGDRFDPVFLEKRRAAFQCFMRRLLKHPRITSSKALYEFCVTQKWVRLKAAPHPFLPLLEDTVGRWCGGGAASPVLRLELLEDTGVVGMLPLPFYDWSCSRGGAIH